METHAWLFPPEKSGVKLLVIKSPTFKNQSTTKEKGINSQAVDRGLIDVAAIEATLSDEYIQATDALTLIEPVTSTRIYCPGRVPVS